MRRGRYAGRKSHDRDRPENWANKNCVRLKEDKCEILDLEENNPKQPDWWGSVYSVALLKRTWGSKETTS